MPRQVIPDYTVIRDTREKLSYGWIFPAHTKKHKSPRCQGTLTGTLATGDYTLVGYSDIFCVERKFGWDEIWCNFLNDKRRFEDELVRMADFKYKYIIIESYLTKEIYSLSPPQCRTQIPGRAMVRWLERLGIKNNIPIYAAGSMSQKRCQYLMEEVIRLEKDRWVPQKPKGESREDCLGF